MQLVKGKKMDVCKIRCYWNIEVEYSDLKNGLKNIVND